MRRGAVHEGRAVAYQQRVAVRLKLRPDAGPLPLDRGAPVQVLLNGVWISGRVEFETGPGWLVDINQARDEVVPACVLLRPGLILRLMRD